MPHTFQCESCNAFNQWCVRTACIGTCRKLCKRCKKQQKIVDKIAVRMQNRSMSQQEQEDT